MLVVGRGGREVDEDLRRLRRGRGAHLGRLTAVLAGVYGDRPAFEDPSPTPGLHPGGLRTHRQLEHAVARLAAFHQDAGIRPDDRVLIVLDNRIDIALHAMAVARLRAIPVPVNGRLRPAELEAVRHAAGADWFVADDDPAARLQAADVGASSAGCAPAPRGRTGTRSRAGWTTTPTRWCRLPATWIRMRCRCS